MRVLRIFSKIKQPELCKTHTHNIIKRGNDNGPSLLFSSYDVTIVMKWLYITVFKKRWIGPPIFRWSVVCVTSPRDPSHRDPSPSHGASPTTDDASPTTDDASPNDASPTRDDASPSHRPKRRVLGLPLMELMRTTMLPLRALYCSK
jgi:hypothetical protein